MILSKDTINFLNMLTETRNNDLDKPCSGCGSRVFKKVNGQYMPVPCSVCERNRTSEEIVIIINDPLATHNKIL